VNAKGLARRDLQRRLAAVYDAKKWLLQTDGLRDSQPSGQNGQAPDYLLSLMAGGAFRFNALVIS